MGKSKYNDHPFPYHAELEVEITTLTNLGLGLGRVALPGRPAPALPGISGGGERERADSGVPRGAGGPPALPRTGGGERAGPGDEGSRAVAADAPADVCNVLRYKPEAARPEPCNVIRDKPAEPAPGGGWVVMVPFTLPGERVRARVFRNYKNFSEADLVAVLTPSTDRVVPRCGLYGRCGGCQYQHLAYPAQLAWKRRQVSELLEHLAGVSFPVAPVIGSPQEFGYRSKITPHFNGGGRSSEGSAEKTLPIGFLRQGTRFDLVDVPRCEIATDAINARLPATRAETRARIAAGDFARGGTLLLRDAGGAVTSDYDAIITEEISLPPAVLRLRFLARDFFQNNPFILPAFTAYVRDQAAGGGARYLVDAYCGSGLFALAAAPAFTQVVGVEVSASSVRFACENAAANGVANATFQAGDAAAIFAGLTFPSSETVVVIDPPRKGCDESFLAQLLAYGPRTVVYVSCDPATQMRDLRQFLAVGYALTAVQPFDLFPQTRHLECVITLRREQATRPDAASL